MGQDSAPRLGPPTSFANIFLDPDPSTDGENQRKTQIVAKTTSPVWNQSFKLSVELALLVFKDASMSDWAGWEWTSPQTTPPPHTHTRSRCRLLFSARFEIDCSFIPMDVERGTRLHIAVWSKSVPFCFNIRDASCISWTPPMKPQTPSSAMASPHSQLVFPLFLFPCLAGTVAPISTRAASHFPSTTSPRVCDVFLGVCVCLCLYLCMCLCLSVCDRGRENQVVSATVPRDLGLCLMLLALHVPATLL